MMTGWWSKPLGVGAPSKTPEKLCVDKFYAIMSSGKVAEWFNASVLKTDVVVRLPRVRLPLFPN